MFGISTLFKKNRFIDILLDFRKTDLLAFYWILENLNRIKQKSVYF